MELRELLEKAVGGLGYELADLEFGHRGRLLRVFIDKPNGVTIDDCALVSNHLSRLLAVELNYDYDRLEVSSPGLDRPLKKEADFHRFRGEKAQIRLRVPIEGRRNIVGILGDVRDGCLELTVDGVAKVFELANIEKARLVPVI